jgi:hypothetical protein
MIIRYTGKKKGFASGSKGKIIILECVWYCGSCCGCGLKKVVL